LPSGFAAGGGILGLLDKLFGRGPKSVKAYQHRAHQRALEGDLPGAIAALDEAIRLVPGSAETYCDRGWYHLEKEMYDEAFADFTTAIELNPNYTLAYNNRAVAYCKLHDWDLAIADYLKALELDPDHPWARVGLVNSYVDRAQSRLKKCGIGEFASAMADYDRALELDPGSPVPYRSRGIAYFDHGKYDKAIADFATAIRIEKTWDLLFERGRARFYNGQFPEAIADLTAALDLRPDNPLMLGTIRYFRARAYHEEKNHERAIADLTDCIGMGATDSEPYIYRAASYAELGRFDQAIGDFTAAMRIQPSPEAYRGRADAYRKNGQIAEALGDCTELIELEPEMPSAYQLRAETYRAMGDLGKAALDDTRAQAAVCLGQALERLQHSDWDHAVSLATEGIRLDSSKPNGYVRRGVAYLGKNEPARALADFNYALEDLPSLPSTIRALVEEKREQACRALGNVKETAGARVPSTVSQSRGAVDIAVPLEAFPSNNHVEAMRPSAQRVAARAMVLSAIVCRALLEKEHEAGNHEHAEGRTALHSWIEELGLRPEIEPAELDFLLAPVGQASPRQTIDGQWRKEGLCVLAWALGRFALPPYDEPAEADAVLHSLEFLSKNDAAVLRESAGLRPADEISRFASHITIVHWRIRTFQLDPELVAPSVQFDVRGDFPVPMDKNPVLRKLGGTGIRESMDFAGYLRQHPRFNDYWLDHLRLKDGDLVIGDRGVADAFPPSVERCRSIAVERQIAAYWLRGDTVTYSKVEASTMLSSC
jgi:tetratricopeptide (TPR) repeat protein